MAKDLGVNLRAIDSTDRRAAADRMEIRGQTDRRDHCRAAETGDRRLTRNDRFDHLLRSENPIGRKLAIPLAAN
jgi:hypothetical protein